MMVRTLLLFSVLLSPSSQRSQEQEWERTRSIAEAQHNIVMLLIKNHKFDEVIEQVKKTYSLNFPESYEYLLVEDAKIISDALIKHQQHTVAHRVLDEAIKSVRTAKLKAALFKEKGYVCMKQGDDEMAMKHFERAISLESSEP